MKKGFTLIELIMVIVIIGILAAIAIPKFIDLKTEAEKAACEGTAAAIRTAISNYYASAVIAGASQEWPAGLNTTFFSGYMQDTPDDPVSASWDTHYSATTGLLDMGAACP